MTVVAILPVSGGREENIKAVVHCLERQTLGLNYLLVEDGEGCLPGPMNGPAGLQITMTAHVPGQEQPRNVGVRWAQFLWPEMTHAWFLDCDILLEPDAHLRLVEALSTGIAYRVLAGPYDWLNPAQRVYLPRHDPGLMPDTRWAMMDESPPSRVYMNELHAGLGCFSGNLCWPVAEFKRVGGFWNELHMGRTEDGELGLRAVCMQVPVSMMNQVRGCHLYHETNGMLASQKNQRDVPMINSRHAWMPDTLPEHQREYQPDYLGDQFRNVCPNCSQDIRVRDWWTHVEECGVLIMPS